jgi:hypothetical protein
MEYIRTCGKHNKKTLTLGDMPSDTAGIIDLRTIIYLLLFTYCYLRTVIYVLLFTYCCLRTIV